MKLKYILLVILVLLIVGASAGFVYLRSEFKASVPQRSGTIQLQTLQAPVTITFDQMGIPQVWAHSTEDLWFAMGWLHAADRLFQMDLTRRVSQGRLAEFFGSQVLEIDRSQRKIGHSLLAQKAVDSLSIRAEKFLDAYVTGINSWVENQGALPFEYLLLNAEFEKWTIQDCLTLFSFQTWFSDVLQNNDEFYNEIARLSDPDSVKQLLMGIPAWIPTTVPQQRSWYSFFDIKDSFSQTLFADGIGSFYMSSASNSWVISPKKSATGYAMLASDPHLDISRLPQFWHIIGLHCQQENINVLGITSPGVPIIVYGHNGQAAWAFTAGGVDIADQFVELINPQDSTEYKTPNGWEKFSLRREIIISRDIAVPETMMVKTSRHGPVMSENDSLGQAYAFRWAGFDVSLARAADNALKIVTVNNFKEFRQIVTGLGALNANWMYADARGNIGYQLGSPIPVRQNSQSVFRVPGWTDENEWQGYQPLERTPHSFNPERGWLASCNNPPAGEDLGYTLHGNFAGDRILRIVKLLEADDAVSVTEMQTYQNDYRSEFILRWKEPMIEVLTQLEENELAETIARWDGQMSPDSKQAALTETWLANLKDLTFRDELGDFTDRMHLRVLFRDRIIYRLYMNGKSTWFDDKSTKNHTESRDEIARRAMQQAITEVSDKTWGELQQLTMAHPMATVPVLSELLALEHGPFPRGGNPGTLNASTSMPDGSGVFKVLGGPSWRFVIDFANVDEALMAIPSGQSGNPMDDHFFDFYSLWAGGEYWNIPFNKTAVMEKKKSVLELMPANIP